MRIDVIYLMFLLSIIFVLLVLFGKAYKLDKLKKIKKQENERLSRMEKTKEEREFYLEQLKILPKFKIVVYLLDGTKKETDIIEGEVKSYYFDYYYIYSSEQKAKDLMTSGLTNGFLQISDRESVPTTAVKNVSIEKV